MGEYRKFALPVLTGTASTYLNYWDLQNRLEKNIYVGQ